MMHPFEVAAEPVRRRIIEVLAAGEHPVGILNDVIAAEFSVSRSAVSHHLRILRSEGVVIVEPGGAHPQSRRYRLNGQYLERLDHAVGDLYQLWDHRYGFALGRMPIGPATASRAPRQPLTATSAPLQTSAEAAPETDRRQLPPPKRAGRKGQRGRSANWPDGFAERG